MSETVNWLNLADKFAADGDPQGMRACARELWESDARSKLEGAAVMAEAALYGGDLDEAASLADGVLQSEPQHLRARLVSAGVAAREFRLDAALPGLHDVVEEAMRKLKALDSSDAYYATLQNVVRKAQGWMADMLYLAGRPEQAAEALRTCARFAVTPEQRAIFTSKALFMDNYRELAPAESRQRAEDWAAICPVKPYQHAAARKIPDKRLRIGYLSPDWREHAVASFVTPLLAAFDRKNFQVYVYATGREDDVTRRLHKNHVNWRDLQGRSPRTAARIIDEDKIDILVDLSGHTQGSCLPIMAYKPAPVQIAGIGYMNTTGLPAIDYFLSDETCLPTGDEIAASAFTEQIIRLPHSHLCYSPRVVRRLPDLLPEAPSVRNGFVTFGSFNDFNKVTDEMLLLWRGILDSVKDAKLVIKGKVCSVPSGCDIVKKRLQRLNFDVQRVELRPYSPDYLEQYRDIDVALDTAPYNGGLTTCEALCMGVPVISIRGRTHGARFGASILKNAGVQELLVENDLNYLRRAVQLGKSPKLINAYHGALREQLRKSALMNEKQYMKELESAYKEVWRRYCTE
ncbi:MAG: hypothetical protein II145_00780 [Selenomonas sp.]|nr:hypothetical protein [Selenomonas sp.]